MQTGTQALVQSSPTYMHIACQACTCLLLHLLTAWHASLNVYICIFVPQRMTGEIRDIMAQYMPLDEERRRTGGTGGGGGMRGGGGGVGASGRGGRGDRAGLMSGQGV